MQYSLLVAFTLLLLGIIQGDLISTLSYAPNVGMKQPDEKLHVVVPLLTSSYDTECANYCTHRGSVFRDTECGAFFVKNYTQCHLVPKMLANYTVATNTETIYYVKV